MINWHCRVTLLQRIKESHPLRAFQTVKSCMRWSSYDISLQANTKLVSKKFAFVVKEYVHVRLSGWAGREITWLEIMTCGPSAVTNKNDRERKMKNKPKNKVNLSARSGSHWFSFSGGFYSDNLAFVAKGCKKCPNGSYVAYDKKPGKSVLDCKTCPLGKQALTITYLYIGEMPNGRIYSRHIPNQEI